MLNLEIYLCQNKLPLNLKKDGSAKVNHDVMPLKGELAHDIEVITGTHLHDLLSGNKFQKDNIHIEVNELFA